MLFSRRCAPFEGNRNLNLFPTPLSYGIQSVHEKYVLAAKTSLPAGTRVPMGAGGEMFERPQEERGTRGVDVLVDQDSLLVEILM